MGELDEERNSIGDRIVKISDSSSSSISFEPSRCWPVRLDCKDDPLKELDAKGFEFDDLRDGRDRGTIRADVINSLIKGFPLMFLTIGRFDGARALFFALDCLEGECDVR